MKRQFYRKRVPKDATPEERACTSKKAHPSEMDARISAQKRIFVSQGELTSLAVYHCRFCSKWHVTSGTSQTPGRVTLNSLCEGVR